MELSRRLIHISGILTIVLSRLGKSCCNIGSVLPNRSISRFRVLESQQNNTSSCHIRNETGSSPGRIFKLDSISRLLRRRNICCTQLFSILTLGDGLSSVVGMRLGRHRICYNQSKTLEGSTTCFLACILSTLIFVSPLIAFAGSITGTLTESFSSEPAENILIPVISGICMSMLFLFM